MAIPFWPHGAFCNVIHKLVVFSLFRSLKHTPYTGIDVLIEADEHMQTKSQIMENAFMNDPFLTNVVFDADIEVRKLIQPLLHARIEQFKRERNSQPNEVEN